ncbi:hypothetical protein CMI47_05765 [Candidatus Pacearchaeota archaeon]|nr:hypothetical protein [Candidatus Pacearchaeota archaeon]|tara:strand:+ start:3986 stop:4258 length:273 start_codon:yes stop_codon:yes gene_type:complete
MPQISNKNKEKIQEQILHHLFEISPDSAFTNQIASQIVRDEEFTKTLLLTLKSRGLIAEINQNPKGFTYKRRQRWRLSNTAHKAYSQHQS